MTSGGRNAFGEDQDVRVHCIDSGVSLFSERLPLGPGVVPGLVEDVDTDDVADTPSCFVTGQCAQVGEPFGGVIRLNAGDTGRIAAGSAGGVFAFEVVVVACGVNVRRAGIETTLAPIDVVGAGVNVEQNIDTLSIQNRDNCLERVK